MGFERAAMTGTSPRKALTTASLLDDRRRLCARTQARQHIWRRPTDDAAPAPAAPADIAVKVAEIRFPARGVGPGRPGARGSVPRLLLSGCRPRTLVLRSRVCRPDRWRHQMWIARPRLLRVASWNASVRVGWAWMVPATSSRSAPISIANVNSPMSSETWAPTAWTPSTR